MKLPSKIFTYKESSLSKLAPILKCLEERSGSPAVIYKANKKIFKNTNDFADCLTVLFALGKIKFDPKSERIELC